MTKKRGKPHNPKPRPKEPPPRPSPYVGMHFCTLDHDGAPHEGAQLLVRLRDGSFRYGAVRAGRFCGWEHNTEEFVTMPHPERITHWMEIEDPVSRGTPATDMDEEAAFQSQGERPDLGVNT